MQGTPWHVAYALQNPFKELQQQDIMALLGEDETAER